MIENSVEAKRDALEALRPEGFDEEMYVARYRDVEEGIATGLWISGLEHFARFGATDGRQYADVTALEDRSAPPIAFDERFYLATYDDVAAAVKDGSFASAIDHFFHFGHREKRRYASSIDIPAPIAELTNLSTTAEAYAVPIEYFDEQTYLELHPGVTTAIQSGEISSALEHYTMYGAAEKRAVAPGRIQRLRMSERLARFSPADPLEYAQRYSDVSSMTAHDHYATHGWREGRRIISQHKIAAEMGLIRPERPSKAHYVSAPLKGCSGLPVTIFANSNGNFFMSSIAEDLKSEFANCGFNVQILDENASIQDVHGCCVFVAPHEFFSSSTGARWAYDRILAESCMVNTEQIQTQWYEQSLPYLMMSKSVIDMYYHSSILLQRSGVPSLHWLPDSEPKSLPLTSMDYDHPLFRGSGMPATVKPETVFEKRPIDICFFGQESEKRDATLARCAETFSRYRTIIYYRRMSVGPLNLANGGDALVRLASHASACSKITLNLHRDEFGAFEWFRIVRLGICSGSVAVTDTCLPVPTFEPGIHYFQTDARHIPHLVDWLLKSEDGKQAAERVRQNSFSLVSRRSIEKPSAATLGQFIVDHYADPLVT